jgi:subtilase family serine protease
MRHARGFLLSILIEFNHNWSLMGHRNRVAASLLLLLTLAGYSAAATPDRITQLVDAGRTRILAGNVHHLAQPQYDQGAADPRTPMSYMVFLVKPSASQQSELKQLLSDQQNPVSPQYHQWLTPEVFGERFGLSEGDLAKVAGWLKSEGFAIDHQARGRNWIAFSGTAGQTARGLHTSIHRYVADGKTAYANASEPSVPEALADVAGGFLGLNNFPMQPAVRSAQPEYNSGSSHFLAPADFATIYDLAPLYQAGLDGTGQSIAVVANPTCSRPISPRFARATACRPTPRGLCCTTA